jgi:hypothetical protein
MFSIKEHSSNYHFWRISLISTIIISTESSGNGIGKLLIKIIGRKVRNISFGFG